MFVLNGLKYKQNVQECITTIMSFKEINSVAEVLIYDEDRYGYQRALNKTHYLKIKKSLLEKGDLISPTSIILGINKSDLSSLPKSDETDNFVKIEIDTDSKLFRVIDGQHRLQGIREAAKVNADFEEYQLNIVIMLIDDDNRSREVQIFSDINSKAKNLKMDLTILAQYRYDLLEGRFSISYLEHICVAAAHTINEKDNENVWQNAIKLDVNTPKALGIVGFKSFYETLKSTVERITEDMTDDKFKQLTYDEQLKYIEIKSNKLAEDILIPSWKVVKKKWKRCFKKGYVYYNGIDHHTYFSNEYYIQKTMGAKAINKVLAECIEKNEIETALKIFEDRIMSSKLTSDDWLVGGTFAGMSSLSGVNKIASSI